jgi:hypothetical protein
VVLNLVIEAKRRCRAVDQAEMCSIHLVTQLRDEVKGDTYGQVNGIVAFKTKQSHKTVYVPLRSPVDYHVAVSEWKEKVRQTS